MNAVQAKAKIADALDRIDRSGGVDGEHHKQWALDQVVRILAGKGYAQWVAKRVADGYAWSEGIAP